MQSKDCKKKLINGPVVKSIEAIYVSSGGHVLIPYHKINLCWDRVVNGYSSTVYYLCYLTIYTHSLFRL